jgi:hypothetical protein
VTLIFAQSFDLVTPDKLQIDNAALQDFAKNWISFMKAIPQSWKEIPIEATQNNTNPGGQQPGGPGGIFPGGPGGGPGGIFPGGPGGGR